MKTPHLRQTPALIQAMESCFDFRVDVRSD